MKLRDQKQLDFEDLSAYLSQVTTERDRLAGGYAVVGLGGWVKDKWEAVKEGGEEKGREGRLRRLEGRIKEVNGSHRL
jgi:sorting nexin-4